MKVKELINKLKKYPEDTLVGGTGHFGEYLELEEVWMGDTLNENNGVPGRTKIVCIMIEDAGKEPD